MTDAFPALRALTEALLTRADPDYLRRQIDAAVKVMAARGCEPPTPWPDPIEVALSDEAIWRNDRIMEANAVAGLGLPMPVLGRLVRAVAASIALPMGESARWTIIGPDGWKLTADKPIELIVEANKHQREIDPVEAERQHKNLVEAIAQERAEHERDRAELVDRFLRWPLPRTVFTDAGTGTVASSQRPENWSASGTNLLTADEARAMLAFVLDCDEGDRELARRSMQCKPTDAGATPSGELSDAMRMSLLNKLARNRGFENVTKALASLPLAGAKGEVA